MCSGNEYSVITTIGEHGLGNNIRRMVKWFVSGILKVPIHLQ